MSAAGPENESVNPLLPGLERWPSDPSRPVVVLSDIWKSFGPNAVLRGLELTLLPGCTTVLAGRSGSGKSLVVKLAMGLLTPDRGAVTAFGDDLARVAETRLVELRKRMAMVFQSYALFDSLSVAANVGFSLRENTSLAEREIHARVMSLLERFDLGDAAQKLPAELSGGMKKRVSLARALITNPEVVFFDEPTTGLDPVMTERVDELLIRVRDEFQVTSLVVSHDMVSAQRIADRVAVLDEGRIVAYGTPREVAADTSPVVRAFFENSETAARQSLGSDGRDDEAATSSYGEEPAAELRDVYKRFGSHEVLRGVDLKVRPGLITVIIGGSGTGKSVIIKHLMGLLKPDAGQVLVFGEDITAAGERSLEPVRSRMGMLFQNAALLDSLTVAENVMFPLVERLGMSRRAAREKVEEMLERVHIPDIADSFPAAISIGQRKRVGLARALITSPELLIYDEPTTGQDPVMTRYVDDMIVETQENFDVTSVVISHDMPSAFRIGHRIAMLYEGRIIADEAPVALAESADPRVREFIYAASAAAS